MFRYVKIKTDEQDMPIELEIKESFCGFVEVESQKSADLEKILLDLINKFNYVSKIRGQGYNGPLTLVECTQGFRLG